MSEDKTYIPIRVKKENEGLKDSLRDLAKKKDKKLNAYLNDVLSTHVKEANDTNED